MEYTYHIDFETYSECDLKLHGAWVYSQHPTTRVLCVASRATDENGELIHAKSFTDEGSIRSYLKLALNSVQREQTGTSSFYAHNSFFECCIIWNTLKLDANLLDFTMWNDTMAIAHASGYPSSLAMVAMALNLDDDKQKSGEGKELIGQLCKLQKSTSKKDSFMLTPEEKWGTEYAEKLQGLVAYCEQDVIAEAAIADHLRPLSDDEREVWVESERINWRGMKVDVPLCQNAYTMYMDAKGVELARIKEISGLANPNSRDQLLGWVREQGIEIDNLQSATINEMLENQELPADVYSALLLRSTASRTPPTKYKKMLAMASRDKHRIHGMLTYHGAHPGRWASRGINTMNLPRPIFKDYELPVEMVLQNDAESLELYYGNVINSLCSTIRPALKASDGCRLITVDYASIEARVLAWLANEQDVLDVFAGHGKVYEHAAAGIYNKNIEDVTKDERFIGKTSILALGYQGGYKAFLRMAHNYGVDIPELLAKTTVTKWRNANPNIVNLWADAGDMAMQAVMHPGQVCQVNGFVKYVAGKYKGRKYLWCQLPSGRLISYVDPHIGKGKYGNELRYFGMDSFTRQWSVIKTYGGKLVENFTQAVARDVLAYSKLRLRGTVYDNIVLSVYDEVVCDVPMLEGSVSELEELLCVPEPWMEGLPIAAEGEELSRYWK